MECVAALDQGTTSTRHALSSRSHAHTTREAAARWRAAASHKQNTHTHSRRLFRPLRRAIVYDARTLAPLAVHQLEHSQIHPQCARADAARLQ